MLHGKTARLPVAEVAKTFVGGGFRWEKRNSWRVPLLHLLENWPCPRSPELATLAGISAEWYRVEWHRHVKGYRLRELLSIHHLIYAACATKREIRGRFIVRHGHLPGATWMYA